MIHQSACFADVQSALLDRGLAGHAQTFQQQVRVMLHGFQHVSIGVATHHMVHLVAASRRQSDVHGIGAPEEVVQIAHHFLVGTTEKHADQVRLLLLQVMQFQQGFGLSLADETRQFAVGIAGEVCKMTESGGLFVEPVDRHQREELLNRPGVRG